MFLLLLIFVFTNTVSSSLLSENLRSLANTKALSIECLNQLLHLDTATYLKLVDSSTKIPNGLLDGNFWDLGDFDECYNIETTATNDIVYGKFCIGTMTIPLDADIGNLSTVFRTQLLHPNPRNLKDVGLSMVRSICLPHKCTVKEIFNLLKIPDLGYKEMYCYSKDTSPQLTTGAIITIVVLSIFLLIVACSTTFDIYLHYTNNKPSNDLLIVFSALTNGKKLFIASNNADQLSCLNGIRAISMMWVVLGHCYAMIFAAPLFNMLDLLKFATNNANAFIVQATVSVDTFFTIGGTITAYLFLKSMDQGKKFNVLLFYLHRYLRLTPALGICMLVYTNLVRYTGNGPLWGEAELLMGDCTNAWWSSLLYIENYTHKVCVPQAWYLSVDMQLFILSPLILVPLWRFEKIGVSLLSTACILGVIVPFTVAYIYKIDASSSDYFNYLLYYYIQTHARFGPYVIGMLLGYFLFKIKKGVWKISLKPIYVLGLWLISLAGMLACLYAPHDSLTTYDRISHSFILGFQRPAWSLGVSIVIYLCVCGYGGPIDKFLSLSIFQVLAKLSYAMYLVHYAVVIINFAKMKTPLYFSSFDVMFMFWGNFMLTLVISIVLCLTFESPIIVLEKYLFGRGEVVQRRRKIEP